MKAPDREMDLAIRQALSEAEDGVATARSILNDPKGKREEALEDALNLVQDAGYRARRAYRGSGS